MRLLLLIAGLVDIAVAYLIWLGVVPIPSPTTVAFAAVIGVGAGLINAAMVDRWER